MGAYANVEAPKGPVSTVLADGRSASLTVNAQPAAWLEARRWSTSAGSGASIDASAPPGWRVMIENEDLFFTTYFGVYVICLNGT